jgi:Flp pilus assembly protein CpaB
MPDRLDPAPADRLRQFLANRGWPRALALRRLFATALILLAALLALRPAARTGEPVEPLVVAAHDLAPGVNLTAGDVRVVPVPVGLRPSAGLGSAGEVTGRVLAGAAASGEPITRARLVGPENTRLATGGPDAVAVPVRLADAGVADLLTPGARVDVVTADPHSAAAVLAEDATVVTVRSAADDRATAERPGRLVVVAMPRDKATRVASVSLKQPVTVTLR